MIKKLIAVGALLAVGGTVVALCLMFSGPNMKYQLHVRTFAQTMPPPPAGAVPLVSARVPLPTEPDASGLANPIEATAANVDRGRVYYEYYCAFCHGARGFPDTPVARGYVPAPADLRSAMVRAFSDGQLLRASFSGNGHSPVLEYAVPAERRWYITLYVKALASGAPVTPAIPPKSPPAVPRLEQ